MSGYIGSRASVVSSGAERKKTFDITGTTTSLTGLSYTVNQVHVFHNGVRLVDGTDFTATNGSSITLTSAAESGDEVVVISYAGYQVSDTVSASQGGTFSGALDVNASSATVLTVDRATSDGTILDLKKDGSTVGSVGTRGGDLLIGTGDVALRFSDSSDAITAQDITLNQGRDAAVDLGLSGTRFKDLYLSGGVYLGGTGSANKLDDYEEGTWTPVVKFGTTSVGQAYQIQTGFYTKVGRLVTFTLRVQLTNKGTSTGNAQISGLPFSMQNVVGANTGVYFGFVNNAGTNWGSNNLTPTIDNGGTIINLRFVNSSGNYQNFGHADFNNTTDLIMGGQIFTS